MRAVIVDGPGGVGAAAAGILGTAGHDVYVAAAGAGIDVMTGRGLDDAVGEADVLIDASGSTSPTATANIVRCAENAGVGHLMLLSHVGTTHDTAHSTVEAMQERLVACCGLPFSIVRSTHLFEFVRARVDRAGAGRIAVPDVIVQPIAGSQVAALLAGVAQQRALDAVIECAGPEYGALADFVELVLAHRGIRATAHAGAELRQGAAGLGMGRAAPDAVLSGMTLREWLRHPQSHPRPTDAPGSPTPAAILARVG
jgi:hypothetical protein